jgi:hypothetical protein
MNAPLWVAMTSRNFAQGFDDKGMSGCVQVVAYFDYVNRIAEVLGVAGEGWIEDNGRPRDV